MRNRKLFLSDRIHKISQHIKDLNITINQLNSIDIYKTHDPKPVGYSSNFSCAQTFSKIDQITGHKTNLHKSRIVEFIEMVL